MSEKVIHVYIDLRHQTAFVGKLYMRVLRGRESATFVYDSNWLTHKDRFALDPVHLPLSKDTFSTAGNQVLFNGLSDSAPDRWGRNLMARRLRMKSAGKTIFESDYLLMVNDFSRQGAVRFKLEKGESFLDDSETTVPPLIRLGELLNASDQLQSDEIDHHALQLLLAPGSSLGGARPKASVLDNNGCLAIAKFPSNNDSYPIIRWEKIAYELAQKAGVAVPASKLIDIKDRAVLVINRFDRSFHANGHNRVPFLSAMAMIGATDGEEHSYLEIADAIRQHGSNVAADLKQLWRRMVVNVLISNTDDHLRNHGFLWMGNGWALSPAYDMNPVPIDEKPRIHCLSLDDSDPEASIDTLLSVADYFGIERDTAKNIVAEVASVTRTWRDIARLHGLSSADIERMASAFEHEDYQQAIGLSEMGH